MGTIFAVTTYGRDADYLAGVVDEVFEEVDRLDAQMSNYKPQSELSGINRDAASTAVMVEPKLFRLLQDSVRYSEETNGAFDITVGSLMEAWGFFRGEEHVPDRAEIERVLQRVGYRHVRLDAATRTVRFDTQGVELDLGAIAKGYAVDQAVTILRSHGVGAALVSNGTSSIYALGSPPGERGWRVTVRDPYDARKAGDLFRLRNYALSVSGNYENFFKIGDRIYCHIMNPHTGWPVENMLSGVVLAASTTETDALSTSFFVLGTEGSRRYLATHPNLTAVFYQRTDSSGDHKRVMLRSDSYRLPPDTLAELDR